MELFTLAAKLTLDATNFDKGLDNAEKSGNGLSKKLNKVVSVAKKLAGALVLKKAISSMKSLADSASAAGDAIDKNSQKLGMSRKAYQEWEYILSQSGASIDSLGTSMKTLRNAVSSGSDAFEKLGLSVDDLQLMSQEEQFEAVVKALQQLPEGAEKSALAVELLGKNGQELMPLLNGSADSVDELRQKFHDLGLELSDEQIDAAVKYGDEMDNLKRVFDGVKTEIGMAFLPMLSDLAEKGAAYAGKLLAAFKEDGLQGVFDTLDTDLTTLTQNMRDSGNPILQDLADIIDGVKDGIKIAIDLFKDFPGTVKKLKTSDSWALRALGNALEILKGAIDFIITAFKSDFKTAIEELKKSDSPVLQTLGDALGVIETVISSIVDFFTNFDTYVADLQKSDSPVLQTLGGALETIKGVIDFIITAFSKDFDTAVADLQKSDSPVLQTLGDALATIKSVVSTIIDFFTHFDQNVADLQRSDNPVLQTLGGALEVIKGVIEFIISAFSGDISNAITTLQESDNPVLKVLGDSLAVIQGVIQFIIDAFNTGIGGAIDNLQNSDNPVLQVLGGALQGIVDIINAIISAAQSAIEWIKTLLGYDGKKVTITKEVKEQYTQLSEQAGQGNEQAMHDLLTAPALPGVIPGTAKGSWSIPYDDYLTRLHRGEMVLTKSQARQFREGSGNLDLGALTSAIIAAVRQGMANATVNSYLDGKLMTDEISRIMGNDLEARRFA